MMKKFFRRFLFIILILVVLAVCLSIIVTSLFGDSIGQRIVDEVNKQITSELSVDKMDISLLSSFPNISINMRDVVLKDTENASLGEIETLSFRLGLLPLIRSKIDVRSILLKDGQINIGIDEQNRPNYLIYETSESTESTESGSKQEIDIQKAIFKNVDVNYSDKVNQQEAKFWIDEATLSGKISGDEYILRSKAELVSRYLELETERYLPGQELAYDAQVNVVNSNDKTIFNLKDVAFTVDQNTFGIEGLVEQKGDDTYLDLNFENQSGDLASILKLLPKEQTGGLNGLSSRGDFSMTASVKGLTNANQQPAIKVAINLERGTLISDQMDQPFKDVDFTASFDNGRRQNNETSVFEIENLTGYFGRERLELHLLVENLNDPKINFKSDGVLPLGAVYGVLDNPKVKGGSGELIAKNINLEGKYNDLINPSRIGRVNASGVLAFDKAALKIEDETLTLKTGEFKLEDNFLAVSELILEGAGSEIAFDGTAYNFLPVLFADSLNSQRAELEFKATLKAKTIDFDRLIALSLVDESEMDAPDAEIDSIKEATIKRRERITNFLNGKFDAVVDQYNYNKIKGEAFKGQVEFINNEMVVQGVTDAMDGQFQLNGQMFFEDEPRLDAKLVCSAIDIQQFFDQTENFGQEILVAKNVDGDLNAKIAINAFWNEEGDFLYDKLRVLAGVGIEEGYLKDFGMLKQFSSFVNIKDLMNIKFTNLQNFFEYRRSKLYIPAMFIQSNAMNLTVSGEHAYDNEMKYNIKVNASQILANRFTRHDPKLKPLKARKKGFLNLYYSIYGSIDDYQIKNARGKVKQDFEQSSIRKRNIQLALEEKFGLIDLVDEPEDWRDIPEYTGEENSEEEEFMDWEITTDSTKTGGN